MRARSSWERPRLDEDSDSAETFWILSGLEKHSGFSVASSRKVSATQGDAGVPYASGRPFFPSNDLDAASGEKHDQIRGLAGDLVLALVLGLGRDPESVLSGVSTRSESAENSLYGGLSTCRGVSGVLTQHFAQLLWNPDDGLEVDFGLYRDARQQLPPSFRRRLLSTGSRQQQQQRQAKGVYVT
ncbi:hypothetical protein BR93DRAFT_966439 [Coniochaeta sp. PMI_546]|nr:hypothetical protein BR93DRAFT_966439 [Coniochaeta sp. PMI_546]